MLRKRRLPPRITEGLELRARRTAQIIMDVPGAEVIRRVRYRACPYGYFAAIETELTDSAMAAEFQRKIKHRLTESGAGHAEIRADRLNVALEVLPGLQELMLSADWLDITMVAKLPKASGFVVEPEHRLASAAA